MTLCQQLRRLADLTISPLWHWLESNDIYFGGGIPQPFSTPENKTGDAAFDRTPRHF